MRQREINVTAGGHPIEVDPNRVFTATGRCAEVRSGAVRLGLSATAEAAALRAEVPFAYIGTPEKVTPRMT